MAWIMQNWAEILLLLIAVDRFVLQIWPDSTIGKMLLNIFNSLKPPQLK